MSVITIQFELTKWHLLVVLAFVALAVVAADVNLATAWHDSRDIKVMVYGQEYSLQDALDLRLLPCGSAPKADTAARAAYADNAEKFGSRLVGDYCR